MAKGFWKVGPKPPDVISPILTAPSAEKTSVWARAGAFMPAMPTRFLEMGFSFPSGSRNAAAPRKPCSFLRLLFGPPDTHTQRHRHGTWCTDAN